MNTLHLIRHAMPEAAGYDNRPPGPGLGDLGRRQAQWIADELQEAGIAQIYASDFTRVLETVRPFADQHPHLTIKQANALREREPSEETHESLVARVTLWWMQNEAEARSQNTAIFSHCGPINMLLAQLDPSGTALSYPFRNEFGCLTPIAGIWRLEFHQGAYHGHLIHCPIT